MSRIEVSPGRVAARARPAEAHAHVSVHRAHDVIDRLETEWTALAAEASEPNPFAEHWFVAASLQSFDRDRDVRLLEVRKSGRLIGLLLLMFETGYGHLPVRHVRNWIHHQAFLGTPLVEAGEERLFWEAALGALHDADWAPGLLYLWRLNEGGPVHRALPGETVYRQVRAFLHSDLSPEAYYKRAVRQKKRKELRRLHNRLADLGAVETEILDHRADLAGWCDSFLTLERAGWKGEEGTALACTPEAEDFFRSVLSGAWDAGRLQFLRLTAGGRTIAMLVNFLTPPGSFSFKTVFDEEFARFSPGVLIQLENLKNVLTSDGIAWMDSCASEDHPMIDGLWMERRSIVRVAVRLKGFRRGLIFTICRTLERASAMFRRITGRR